MVNCFIFLLVVRILIKYLIEKKLFNKKFNGLAAGSLCLLGPSIHNACVILIAKPNLLGTFWNTEDNNESLILIFFSLILVLTFLSISIKHAQ